MRITQGCFSFLPDLTDDQILTQVQYCLDNGWAVNLEYTDDPHPRNTYWEMWGLPMFDLKDAKGVLIELGKCRELHGDLYIRLSAFDSTHTHRVAAHLVHRQPSEKPRRASGSSASRAVAATSATRRAPIRSIARKGSDTDDRRARAGKGQSRRRIRPLRRRTRAAATRRRVDWPRAGQATHP